MEQQSDLRETTLTIDGLCCSTEESLIRKKFATQEGIHSLRFNLLSHQLTVRHSGDVRPILRALTEIGLPGRPVVATYDYPRHTKRRQLFSTVASGSLLIMGGLSTAVGAPHIADFLFILSVLAGGWQIALKGIKAISNRALDMNSLMSVAALGAILIGEYAEAAAVIFLFAVSLLLESLSIDRTRRAIKSLMKLSPASATVRRRGLEQEVPVEDVAVGERIVIRPGERIPLDGTVMAGASTVDQSALTGESLPVAKHVGDSVFAGSINQRGALEVEVTKLGKDSTLARIIHLVEEAQSKRAPSQAFIDRFASIYTPAIFALAVAVASVPPLLFQQEFGEWFYRALVLLVIACPCALVISTPVSLVSAITNAARNGILVKGGKHLETLAAVRAVAFDKTGTLTVGRPRLTDVIELDSLSKEEILRIVTAAELRSEHHLADAFLEFARENGTDPDTLSVSAFESFPGRGVQAIIGGRTFVVGNHQMMEQRGVCSPRVEAILRQLESEGKTVLLLADESRVLGVLAVADRRRVEGAGVTAALRSLGVNYVAMLTGDNSRSAQSVAMEMGLDEVRAELLPEQKLSAVQEIKERFGPTAMVGDGINDAPALAAADVGIAMGAVGSDTALETADVVLMSDDLTKIPYTLALGKKTVSIIKQNIALALVAKFVFLLLGLFGLTSLWLAVLADDGATLIVILNSLRLLNSGASPLITKSLHDH